MSVAPGLTGLAAVPAEPIPLSVLTGFLGSGKTTFLGRVLASPDDKWVATSNIGKGTISLFDAATRAPVKVIAVSEGDAARQVTLLWSRDSKRLYAAETGVDKVAEIDVATAKVLRRIAAGKNGDGLAIAP